MLLDVKTYWQYGTTFCSIELHSTKGDESVVGVTAKKKKGEFKELEFYNASSIADVSKKTPKNQHCFLTINTDKVLIKEIPFTENGQKAVSTAFPGLSSTDFYYQIHQAKLKTFVAVSRKDYVDGLIKEIGKNKLEVIGFSVGFFQLNNLVPYLDKESVQIPGYLFTIEEDEISSFEKNDLNEEANHTIEGIEVSSNDLMALSGLFNYVTDQGLLSNFAIENDGLKTLQSQKNFFRKGMVLGLGVLLFSLLTNFFVFNSYYKKQQALNQEVVILESQKKNFQSKSLEVESKEKIVESILSSSSSKSSFFLNRIAENKPDSILLSELQFQPLIRAVRPDKPVEYKENEIIVGGDSSDKDAFSLWIQHLEEMNWINRVEVVSYGDQKKNISAFEIRILLNDDTEK